MPSPIETLERYPISVILSFLVEQEGTRFLICKRSWTKFLLPVFRLPPAALKDGLQIEPTSTTTCTQKSRRHYRFVEIPVQDASVRLAKLNTRRLKSSGWKLSAKNALQELQGFSTRKEVLDQLSIPPPLSFNKGPKSFSFREGTTLLASYPRSGNTLVRTLLESMTGCVTGSDTRPDRTLSLALAERHGLVGEGIVHCSKTPIVKTHWPERVGFRSFVGHRVVILVRNPFDAIDSYWNLNLTNTHTEKVTDEVYETHRIFFRKLVLNEMKVWLQFLRFWRDQAQLSDVPILWIRYEDLIASASSEISKLMEFVTNQEGAFWSARIQQVLSQRRQGYRSKCSDEGQTKSSTQNSTSFSFGRAISRYDQALLQAMHDLDSDEEGWLEVFGYSIYKQGFPENMSGVTALPEMKEIPSGQTFASMPTPTKSKAKNTVDVNQPRNLELRLSDSPFGRNMRDWRRSHTEQDTRPFPTTSGNK